MKIIWLVALVLLLFMGATSYFLVDRHKQLSELESNIIHSSIVITDNLEFMVEEQLEIMDLSEQSNDLLIQAYGTSESILLNQIIAFRFLVESIDEDINYSPVFEDISSATNNFKKASTMEEMSEATSQLEDAIQTHKDFSQSTSGEYLN